MKVKDLMAVTKNWMDFINTKGEVIDNYQGDEYPPCANTMEREVLGVEITVDYRLNVTVSQAPEEKKEVDFHGCYGSTVRAWEMDHPLQTVYKILYPDGTEFTPERTVNEANQKGD